MRSAQKSIKWNMGARSRVAAALVAVLYASHCMMGQSGSPVTSLQPLAPGTSVPIQLTHELRAGDVKPGTTFLAKTTQRIPVGPHQYLRRGAQVVGQVVVSDAGAKASGTPSQLTLRFSTLRYKGQSVPLSAKTLAIANFVQVMDTAVIATGATDRGNPDPASWTTNQVGGDQVYRSGWIGDVYSSYSHKVGFADYHGVYALPKTPDGLPRALGVFSSDSTGLYGFNDTAKLTASGQNTTISDARSGVLLRKGDDLFLEVLP